MSETLVVIIVMFTIGMIRYALASNKAKRQNARAEQEKWQITPEQAKEAEAFILQTKKDLEIRTFGNLMLSDFRFRTQVSDEDRKDMKRLQAKLDTQLQELISYLHLPQNVHVRVHTDDPRGETAAGNFDRNSRTVNVFYRPFYDAGYLNEILCHECAHYFRSQHQIWNPNKDADEKCTDVTACLMGCRLYMINANNMGYLRPGQFRLVQEFLEKYRKENRQAGRPAEATRTVPEKPQVNTRKPETAPPKDSTAGERESLRRQIEAARAMIRQAGDIMAVKKVPSRTDLTETDYAWLKGCEEKFRAGQYTATLSRCEKELQGSAARIRSARNETMAVCEDMSRLMWIFR